MGSAGPLPCPQSPLLLPRLILVTPMLVTWFCPRGWHCPTRGPAQGPGRGAPSGPGVAGDKCHPLRPPPHIPGGDTAVGTPRWWPRAQGRAGGSQGVPRPPPAALGAVWSRDFLPGWGNAAEEPSTGQELPEPDPCQTRARPVPDPGVPAVTAALGALSRCPRRSPAPRDQVLPQIPRPERGSVEPLCPDNAEESQRFRARGGPRPWARGSRGGGRGDPQDTPRVPPGYPQVPQSWAPGRFGHPGVLGVLAPTPRPGAGLGVPAREAVGTPPLPSSGAAPSSPLPPRIPSTRSLGEPLPGRSGTALIPADLHSSIVLQGPM